MKVSTDMCELSSIETHIRPLLQTLRDKLKTFKFSFYETRVISVKIAFTESVRWIVFMFKSVFWKMKRA